MRSLLLRIFLSFWLIIGITIGVAAVGGFWYAERAQSAFESFQLGDSLLDASAALEADGRDGLIRWLRAQPRYIVSIFVLDAHGDDILGRRLPSFVAGMVARHQRRLQAGDHGGSEPRNLRRARPLTQLVSPEGELFTVVALPPRPPFLWTSVPMRALFFTLALVVSAAVSFMLARAITSPVRELRDATVALAEGNLDVRVAASVGRRRDELGRLARDFDTMADKLQQSAAQQTELTRNISHELRSPLARMRVALELARRKSGESPEFDRMGDEVERLDALIGQILSYSRLDASDPGEAVPIDLTELVNEVVDNVRYECRADGIDGVSVVADIEESIILRGYRDALTSAVENVLRNAVHHSPAGAGVGIRLHREDDDSVIIEVVDDGPGVDESELTRLFDAFYRTRESLDRPGDLGSGLGLAIAARAIRRNGGTIAAYNRPQGGLAVTMLLPLRARGS